MGGLRHGSFVLPREACVPHRPHRVQGLLDVPRACPGRRGRHGLFAPRANRSEPFLAGRPGGAYPLRHRGRARPGRPAESV